MTIRDAKIVSDEIEKEAKKNYIKLLTTNKYLHGIAKKKTKKKVVQVGLRYSHHTVQWVSYFGSCQLIMTWMSNVKLSATCIFLGFGR